MKTRALIIHILLNCIIACACAQVDTSFIYNTSTPYGTLDLRLSRSATRYFYLQEDITFSFRESAPGVKTNTYLDKTSWDSSPYQEGNLREKNGNNDTFILNYRLLHPLHYNDDYKPGYPLVVFLHGAGERANCWEGKCYHADKSWNPSTNTPAAPTSATSALLNNDHQLLHGGSNYVKARNNAGTRLPDDPGLSSTSFPGFVLFPQTLNQWNAVTAQHVIRLVRLMAKKYNIDENRIYITGLSHGGYGLYEVVKRAPWLFAAALPMSAPNDGGIFTQNQAPEVAHIPWWIFQGALDGSPPPSATENRVRTLRNAGAVVRYTKYENLGHGTWNAAFKEPDYFRWILSQTKSKIHVFAGSPYLCDGNEEGVRLELAKGFHVYQWKKDGTTISGATDNFYVAKTPGVYRARFSRMENPSEEDWNTWSDPVTLTTTPTPQGTELEQVGTLFLPDLNGNNSARLKAASKNDYYYWYKDDVQLSIPDTSRMPLIAPSSGSGAYICVTALSANCPAPPSQPKFIFFHDEAPLTITPPNSLAATPAGNTVTLAWNDRSGNESGFELWRRRAYSSTKFSKWELIAITQGNMENYSDVVVEPNVTYHYKMRAISNTGRSDYFPSANLFTSVKTNDDKIKPSAPHSLTATVTGVNTITLKWQAATDNFGIKRYRIEYNGSTVTTRSSDTTFVLTDLAPNTFYSIAVRAEDLRGNIGDPCSEVTIDTYINGLFYQYATGAWSDLDNINWSFAEYTGKVTTFTLAPRTQEDYFNFRFDGYLYIVRSGSYQFQTISSDGSRIELDGVTMVNNDGIHSNRTITSAVQSLDAGPKRITVSYFDYDESHTLNVRYKGPDTNNTWMTIPASALQSGEKDQQTAMQQVARMENSMEAEVYPNPASGDNIHVKLIGNKLEGARISLIDFTGEEVYTTQFTREGPPEMQLSFSTRLREGLYLLKITSGDRIIQKRISITR